MGDIDRKCYDLLSGSGMESILMPRKQFVKEHKNLLKVLKSGDPKALKAEYADQKKELAEQTGGGLAEDKRYINSKTPYTLAKEMSKKELLMYRDDPGVPPSMKDKLAAAVEMKGGMERQLAPCEGEAHTGETTLSRADLDAMKDTLQDDGVTRAQVVAALRTLKPTLSSELDKNVIAAAEEALAGRGTTRETVGRAINLLITIIDRVFPRMEGGWQGSQQAGFVRRMMAEAKLKHGGEPYGPNPRIPSYKNPTRPLHPESVMRKKVPFDFNKIKQEQDGGENDDDNYGPSPFLLRHFGRGYAGGSVSYDAVSAPQSIAIIKDRPHSVGDYWTYKNFAHLLDAFQKHAPTTRQKQAAVPMESTLRFLLEEMLPRKGVVMTQKQDENHYQYSKSKFFKARAAMEAIWEDTGLRKAIEDAAKAEGKVYKDGRADVGAFMPTLISAVERGTEATHLGKPLSDFLFKIGGGMSGGLTEEELRLRDLAKKKAAREAKNSARAAPPARKAKEEEAPRVDPRVEERRLAEEARRREAEEADRTRKLAALVKKVGNRKVREFLKGVVAPKVIAKRPARELSAKEKRREKFVDEYLNKDKIGDVPYRYVPIAFREGRLNEAALARRTDTINQKNWVYKDGAPVQDKDGNYVKDYILAEPVRQMVLAKGDKLLNPAKWKQRFEEGIANDATEIERLNAQTNEATWKIERKGREDPKYYKSAEYLADKEERDRDKVLYIEQSKAWHAGTWLRHLVDRYYSRPPHAISLEEARELVGV